MKHIRFLFILLFLFLSFNAFAATYTVTEYKYTGDEKKTTDFALDNMVNPHTEEVFYDLQSLNNALKAKQQVLWNTTLFSKVEVTYEIISSVDENNSVGINVYVEDAGSSFAFPYPKYDSNYGLIFGLRYKEKNLFGLMASLDASLDVKQQDNSFLKGEYVFDLPITGLRIKNLSFSAGLSGIVDLLNTERSYIRFHFDNDNWQVGTADITAQIDAKYYYDNTSASDFDINVSEKDLVLGPGILDLGFGFRFKPENTPVVNYYKYNLAYKNIPLGEKLLSFSFDGKTYPTENINYVTSESLNSISTSISNIEFGNSVWGGTVSATFQGAQNEDLPARLYKGSSSLTVQIPDGNVKDKKVNQTVLWQLFKNATSGERLDYVKTTTEYSFKMTDHLVDSVVLKTWNNRPAENGPDGFDFDFRVERPFTLFDGTVYFLPIVTFLNQVAYTANSFRYRPNMELALSIQTSGGSIDRVNAGESFYAFRDNFRSGTKYSVQVAGRWAGKAENTSQPQFFARGVLTSFPIKLNFFNPSFRILGIISTDERVWFNRTSSSDPWKIASSVDEDYSYSYNSYSFNEFTFSVEGLNDLLRGVLLKNTAVQNGGFSANTVLVGNINLTSAFLNFEDMGHTYLSPFYDFALFVTNDDVNYIHSVGLEFVAIVDSHPAYPLRVSLGFNADDLSKALSGEESELEHEIFIGMGWFF